MRLHGIRKNIVLDRDVRFTSRFWKELFAVMGTKLEFSIAYHPQIDGKIERIKKILKDILRLYVMH